MKSPDASPCSPPCIASQRKLDPGSDRGFSFFRRVGRAKLPRATENGWADFAQAGGSQPERLDDAFARLEQLLAGS